VRRCFDVLRREDEEYLTLFCFDLKDAWMLRCLNAVMMNWNLTILALPYILLSATRTRHCVFRRMP
jgi:hypothetical protein